VDDVPDGGAPARAAAGSHHPGGMRYPGLHPQTRPGTNTVWRCATVPP